MCSATICDNRTAFELLNMRDVYNKDYFDSDRRRGRYCPDTALNVRLCSARRDVQRTRTE